MTPQSDPHSSKIYRYTCIACNLEWIKPDPFAGDWRCTCGYVNKLIQTRTFGTGATRDVDDSKLDYEGFISEPAWRCYAEYMHRCRLRNIPPGDKIRASDNWQKGIPLDAYMKSMFRHFMDVWKYHRQGCPMHSDSPDPMQDALCAMLFNVQGMLHERLKRDKS